MFIWKKRAHGSGLSIVASFSVSFRILQMGIISIFGPISISLETRILQMEDYMTSVSGLAQASESVLRICVTAKETEETRGHWPRILCSLFISRPLAFSVFCFTFYSKYFTQSISDQKPMKLNKQESVE